MSTIKGDLRSV